MFIVRKKSEVVRFGVFLLLMGAMAFFVASRFQTWRVSQAATPVPAAKGQSQQPALGPILAGKEGSSLMDLVRSTPETQDFFAEYKMDRDRNRSTLRETLKELMDDQNVDAATRKTAGEQYMSSANAASLEDRAESMIKAKGFEDVVVNLTQSGAQAVVKAKSLSEAQAAQVMDMITQITGIKGGSIQVFHRER